MCLVKVCVGDCGIKRETRAAFLELWVGIFYFNEHDILFTVQYILYTVRLTGYNVNCNMYTLPCTLYKLASGVSLLGVLHPLSHITQPYIFMESSTGLYIKTHSVGLSMPDQGNLLQFTVR